MGCEFMGQEFRKDKEKVQHVRDYCMATHEPCLIDDPMGWPNCTRRQWLLMDDGRRDSVMVEGPNRRHGGKPGSDQGRLLEAIEGG